MDRTERNCSCDFHNTDDSVGAVTAVNGFATLAQFDAEIERMNNYTINLKRRRSALVPVFRLLPEILTIIFRMIATFDIIGTSPASLSFSHVCHSWRKLALNCPMLWTHLPIKLSPLTQELLTRSKTLPLTITVEITNEDLLASLAYILFRSNRTEGLRLTEVEKSGLDYLYENLEQHIPALKHLELERCSDDLEDDWENLPGQPFLQVILKH